MSLAALFRRQRRVGLLIPSAPIKTSQVAEEPSSKHSLTRPDPVSFRDAATAVSYDASRLEK